METGYFVPLLMVVSLLCPGLAHADFTWDQALNLFDAGDAPPDPTENGMGDWGPCLNKAWNYQPVTLDAQGALIPACKPDTLYSWGSSIKLMSFLKEAAPHEATSWSHPFPEMVFAHINPLATFGYGDFSIRIKLKSGTKFKYYGDDKLSFKDYCSTLLPTDEEKQNTVIVRGWTHESRSGVDYILCTPGPMHSWSYGTKRHYDEIVASQQWNNAVSNNNKANDWIPYTVSSGSNELYDSGVDSEHWSHDDMLGNLKSMQAAANEGLGEVIFAPGVKPDESSHFSTNHKVYWHWQ